jgi:hypothetical protein
MLADDGGGPDEVLGQGSDGQDHRRCRLKERLPTQDLSGKILGQRIEPNMIKDLLTQRDLASNLCISSN